VLVRFDRDVVVSKGKLRHLAVRCGFGHSIDIADVTDGRGARYCAKYVSKAAASGWKWRAAGAGAGP
jgi:hypothetical protein